MLFCGYEDVVCFLLECGVDVDVILFGLYVIVGVLYMVVFVGYCVVVECLFEGGVDLMKCELCYGGDLLSWVEYGGDEEIVCCLCEVVVEC